jgi:hypothetical protein
MSKTNKQPIHALTNNNHRKTNKIITPVEIKNTYNNIKLPTQGLWDTGATGSVITKSTAAYLELLPIGRTNVRGVHGEKKVNVYFVNITLSNKNITLNTLATECDELSADNSIGMLIGMNIITMGDFAITNYQEKTIMSFRVPSLQTIDFVEELKQDNQ